MLHEFSYADAVFTVTYDPDDITGRASIDEMVNMDAYGLQRFMTQRGVFIDIGANLGVVTLIMAKLNPDSKVYAFEPNRDVFELLIKNLRLNGLSNVEAYNLAVSDSKTTELELIIASRVSGAASTYAERISFARQWEGVSEPRRVPCIGFDDILRRHAIEQVHLLKIDCEGAEFPIIYGSELFKRKVVKNLVGEFHDLHYNTISQKSRGLLEYCKQHVIGTVDITILKI